MSGIKDQQNIDEMKKRLYDRNQPVGISQRHTLTQVTNDVSRGWGDIRVPITNPTPVAEEIVSTPEEVSPTETTPIKKSRSYRLIIMLASIVVFVLVVLASSAYLFFGANQISVKNVSITLNAPFAIGAGEKLPMQISVSNQNSVQIDSATLILNYPPGTKTGDEEARDLYEERIPIDVIAAGEAFNIPINILIFGEENEEKEITASVEYRVTGSNGTFFKEADPVKIKISSSPLILRVESVDKVSSGQEIDLIVTLQSNASAVLRNVLVSASYPNSFIFVKSDPEPVYSQNEWLFSEIAPNSKQVINLKGRINGLTNETSDIQFSVGSPRTDNQFIMGSVLAKAKTSYVIERPFIDVVVDINQDDDGQAVLQKGEMAKVRVRVKNTLEETIYDMRVEISPKGNLIRDNQLTISSGFYDSNSKTILYEVSGMSSLAEVQPGETREFDFSVKADPKQTTGSFDISTNVFARRVNETNATEQIVGTALAQAKYSSEIELNAQVGYNDGNFTDTGLIPPVAGKETTYTVTLAAAAGVNDVTDAVLTSTLPQYVTWLNKHNGDTNIEYNPVSKQIRWNIGALSANNERQLQFQVSLLPSITQVGKTPVIVGAQELLATDRFTEASLRVQNSSLDTELSEEAGFAKGNGRVEAAN